MAGEAAITKVKNALKVWLDGGAIGATTEIDRPFDQSHGDEDLTTPIVNIRCQQTNYNVRGYNNGWQHESIIMFDIITRSSTLLTIDDKQALIAAKIVARLAARDTSPGSIGLMLEFCDPVAMGDTGDDGNLSDQGVMTFQWRMTYLTPINDFIQIFAVTGELIP